MSDRKRAGLFVDVTDQYYAAVKMGHRIVVDYEKYLRLAVGRYSLYRAFAYGVHHLDEAQGFINKLRRLGYESRYQQAKIIDGEPDFQGTDRSMCLAMDVWRCIDKLDLVIIGSGDAIYVPLINRVKELGIQTFVYSCGIALELREVADRYQEIDLRDVGRRLKSPELRS